MSYMSDKSLSLTEMTDEELTNEYNRLFSTYMYYQAAEGNWNKERADREYSSALYYNCRDEMKKRGLET